MNKKQFIVVYSITGLASAVVEAETKEEAREKAKILDVKDGSEEIIEWDFDEVKRVLENE